jgi:6-phosphogluconolactonase (cycloisomerase 2 family)
MRRLTRLAGAAALAAATLTATAAAFAGPAGAAVTHPRGSYPGAAGARRVVFAQTDNLAGNAIVAYHRRPDGTLWQAGQYATHGKGGQLTGSVVDHLASQGSLVYDGKASLLLAVNAGSNTVSVFAVHGDKLALRQVIGSGGQFPVSVTVHRDVAYVVNAENGGALQGYWVLGGRLVKIPGSHRALGLDPTATPQFTNTPGQVAFTPGGRQLIVTTKANGSDIDVFGVGWSGRLSATPVVNSEPGAVPFAISFDAWGHVVIANAGTNALATFSLSPAGTLTQVSAVGTGQAATCWVAPADGRFYASNAGSASVSGYTDAAGQLTLLGATTTDAGTVDAAASHDGRFLYVQTGGAGIVDEFAIGASGALTSVGSITVPGAVGGEGIVAR